MLTAELRINGQPIEVIHCLNTLVEQEGMYAYQVWKQGGKRKTVLHDRKMGALDLIEKAARTLK
jgi:hypothetical protein